MKIFQKAILVILASFFTGCGTIKTKKSNIQTIKGEGEFLKQIGSKEYYINLRNLYEKSYNAQKKSIFYEL